MGLDIWFPQDVARILAATHETMVASINATAPANPDVTAAYRKGFADALRAVAIAFGVAAPSRSGDGQSRPMRIIDVEVQQPHVRSLDAPGW
jgi:hypothetical protein